MKFPIFQFFLSNFRENNAELKVESLLINFQHSVNEGKKLQIPMWTRAKKTVIMLIRIYKESTIFHIGKVCWNYFNNAKHRRSNCFYN
jgi:hypothetical protein